jgi:tRNA(fMet)-specific endonuclease VapC
MYILDTDTLSHLHKGNFQVLRSLQQVQDREVTTTIVTKIEMLRGRIDYLLKAEGGKDLQRAQALFDRTEDLLSQIPILKITDEAVVQFNHLLQSPKYRKIGRADLTIASITLAHRATLVTRNLKHFRQFPGLDVVNWVD